MKNNYRAYFFANMYLPSLHAGIQSQHTTAEMFIKYEKYNSEEKYILYQWAKNNKTTIVLNGGMSGDLQEIVSLFKEHNVNFNPQESYYPWASFSETEYALNGALTNVGIILPEKVYAYDKLVRDKEETGWGAIPKLTEFEFKVVEVLRGKRLMS